MEVQFWPNFSKKNEWESIEMGVNGVVVGRFGLIFNQNEATGPGTFLDH